MQALLNLLFLYPVWGIVLLVLQLGVIVHAVSRGRGQNWLYLLIFLPGVGAVAYLVVEVILPWWRIQQMVKNASHKTASQVELDVDVVEEEWKYKPTFANAMLLADAYSQTGKADKAWELYQKNLVGINAEDEVGLKKFAELAMEMGKTTQAFEVWQRILKIRSGELRPDELLSYARCLEALGKQAEAGEYYLRAAGRNTGLEANWYLCSFLKKTGEEERLGEQVQEAARKYADFPARYKNEEKGWWERIKKEF